MSLRSSSQQPPVMCQMRSAPAAKRTRHLRAVPLGHVAEYLNSDNLN